MRARRQQPQCCLTRKSMRTSVFGRAPREPPSTTLPQRSDHLRHSKQTVCLREDIIVHAYFGIKGVNACFARAGNLLCDSDCSSLGLSDHATVFLTISKQKMQWSLASATIFRHVAAKRSFLIETVVFDRETFVFKRKWKNVSADRTRPRF